MLKNLLLIISSCLFCLLIGECTIRVFQPEGPLEFETDENVYWRFRPKQTGFVWMGSGAFRSPRVKINNLGLCGQDISVQSSLRQRILLLGDSFTFGSGVADHETFGAVLQQTLGNDQIEVINAGAPGYGIFQAEQTLYRLTPELSPQWVLLTIPPGDIFRQPFDTEEEKNRYLSRQENRKRLRKISRLATFIYRKIYYLRLQANAETVPNKKNDEQAFFALWEKDFQRVAGMAGFCTRKGIRFVVMCWPDKRQPAKWSQRISRNLAGLADKTELTFWLNIESELDAIPDDARIIPGDGHPSALAHKTVGEFLARELREKFSRDPVAP